MTSWQQSCKVIEVDKGGKISVAQSLSWCEHQVAFEAHVNSACGVVLPAQMLPAWILPAWMLPASA